MKGKLIALAALGILLAQAAPAHSAGSGPPIRNLANYVYVDLSEQRLVEVHHHAVTAQLHISSGGGYRYTGPDGRTRIALTPVGRFKIYRKATGWQRGYLGAMYYPSYFTGGYAIHGSPSVPARPVSHGCIRIAMGAAVGFYSRNPVGTPVIVVN